MKFVLAFILLISCAKWSKIPYHEVKNKDPFNAKFRTMKEHNDHMKDKKWPYVLKIDSQDHQLIYYGSIHTRNPDDPQISEILSLWKTFKPTVALTENRPGFYFGGMSSAIESHAEFGALKDLALSNDIQIYSLEPSWNDEVNELLTTYDKRDLTIFYTLRVFLNERDTDNKEEIEDLADHLLGKRGSRSGLEGSFATLDEMDQWWKEHFQPTLGDWRYLPKNAIHPSHNPTKLQKIATLANEVRDRHAARVILDFVNKGERVFAVSGGSHVVKQEPVIRAGLK